MRDFTLQRLESLYTAILQSGYGIIPYEDYASQKFKKGKYVIMRHDVDAKPQRALALARLENKFGIRGSYYIRNKPGVYKKDITAEIASLGHEIGYHYEDLSANKGDQASAIRSFELFLKELRTMYPVKTICMHGSPLSRYDNRELWKKYDYRNFGIQAELYMDTCFNRHWYLTDTGRGWNSRFSIRDKVDSPYMIHVSSTISLIQLFTERKLPPRIMMNIHPQRWSDNVKGWLFEILSQSTKNIVKLFIINTLQNGK